jgi:outer membrane protein TolC
MRISRLRVLLLVIGLFAPALAGLAQTGPYLGSASAGPPSEQPLSLTLDEALKMGLRYNLGGITAEQASQRAIGENIVVRSALYPDISGGLRENVQQIDLASYGFKFKFPPSLGINLPTIVGPYNFFDLRGYLTQRVADLNAIRSYQSSREEQRAAEFSAADSREIVVYVVTSAYLQVLAQAARVDSAKVQVDGGAQRENRHDAKPGRVANAAAAPYGRAGGICQRENRPRPAHRALARAILLAGR